MKALWKTLLVCGFGSLAMHAQAQPADRTVGVTISCSCDDASGKAYVDAVKNNMVKDGHFQQMSLQEGAEKGAILVNIISMPVESTDGKPHSVLSIVYSHDGVMVHQFIETCPHLTVEECAMNMVRDLKTI